MTEYDRQNQHLSKKIENVLPIIYSACMTNTFKEKWKWPERDPDTGLFVDKYCKLPSLLLSMGLVRKKKKETAKGDVGDQGEDAAAVQEAIEL